MPLPFNYIDSLRGGCSPAEPCGSTAPSCTYFAGQYPHPGSSSASVVISGITGAFCAGFNATSSIDDSHFGSSTSCPTIIFTGGGSVALEFNSTGVSLIINSGFFIATYGFTSACEVVHAIDALVSGATVQFPYISIAPPVAGCDFSPATVDVTMSL